MPLNNPTVQLSPDEQSILLDVVEKSIQFSLACRKPISVSALDFPEPLREIRSSFVTLRIVKSLRGCMGAIRATQPLVEDVARNAHLAAFSDPRFEPVIQSEVSQLSIQLSILSSARRITFCSQSDLIEQLLPGVDGLILREGSQQGTLLPAVWDNLSDPEQFLSHLKQKAGLPADYWSDSLTVSRYTAVCFGRSKIDHLD